MPYVFEFRMQVLTG